MNRPELYAKTIDILFNAYANDTLERRNCYACAVGNIIAGNMGKSFARSSAERVDDIEFELHWNGEQNWYENESDENDSDDLWIQFSIGGELEDEPLTGKALEQIAATGYTMIELNQIEISFEGGAMFGEREAYLYRGLCEVLETLGDIHEITNDDLLLANKSRFTNLFVSRKQHA